MIKNAAGATKYVKTTHGHAATSLAPGSNKRACKIHENAGHVANAGDKWKSTKANTS